MWLVPSLLVVAGNDAASCCSTFNAAHSVGAAAASVAYYCM